MLLLLVAELAGKLVLLALGSAAFILVLWSVETWLEPRVEAVRLRLAAWARARRAWDPPKVESLPARRSGDVDGLRQRLRKGA